MPTPNNNLLLTKNNSSTPKVSFGDLAHKETINKLNNTKLSYPNNRSGGGGGGGNNNANGLGTTFAIAGTAASIASSAIGMSKLDQSVEDATAGLKNDNSMSGVNDFDTLANKYANDSMARRFSKSDFRSGNGDVMGTIGNTASGAMTGLQVGGVGGAIAGAVIGLGSSIAGILTGNSKARKAANRANQIALNAENDTYRANENSAMNIAENQQSSMLQSYTGIQGIASAFGGRLGSGVGLGLNIGDEIEVTPEEAEKLKQMGYGIEEKKDLKEGDVVDLSQDEIASLLLAGYKLEFD